MLHTRFMSRDVCPIVAHSMKVSTVACMWYLSVEIVIGFRYGLGHGVEFGNSKG